MFGSEHILRCRNYTGKSTKPTTAVGDCGFTIVEVLVVMIIIALAAMLAIPMMSSAGSMQIKSAANLIASDLEYAKSLSISRGQVFSVVFDETNETYQIEDQDGNVIDHPVKKGFTYSMNFGADSNLERVDIYSVNFDGTNEVKFDYLGSPYNGSGTSLNNGIISLRAGTIVTTINVEPITGYISIL